MKKLTILLFMIFSLNSILAQIKENIHELNSMKNLLTEDVKNILDTNLTDKKIVFLGEAEHHIASDFKAKTEFVKYLVLKHGYKDIAFESDFFGLYFDHNKRNIFGMWSNSYQCLDLFSFLEKNNVTLWGFDNQYEGPYSYYNLSKSIKNFLEENKIDFDNKFIAFIDVVRRKKFKVRNQLTKKDINYLISTLDKLLNDKTVESNPIWKQIIESFKSNVLMLNSNGAKAISIRDKQMAKNLDFLIKTMPKKKFIVWLANAHMAKYEYDFMKGQTMGGQFVKMNPDISYHIAISSIHMPYRKDKWIEKSSKDKENLLHFLPSTENNYFIDSKQIINENPDYANKEYVGMFNLKKDKTNWFKHFDALVFISKGEKVKYIVKL
ncbi:erythromycin esterase family protein [uncultured Algibacter sp.]|uniref:erythromycin esterase family protein n=1 Tax=uncultured Algibacter sp. TaxID=298659 RepID=UPI00262995CA|nr:erythromycin esterase family protein [uncultured Algibacter sp.]